MVLEIQEKDSTFRVKWQANSPKHKNLVRDLYQRKTQRKTKKIKS